MTSVGASFFASFDTAALPSGGAVAGQPATGAFGALLASVPTGETASAATLSLDAKLPGSSMTALLAGLTDLTAAAPDVSPAVISEPLPTTVSPGEGVETAPVPDLADTAASVPATPPVATTPKPFAPAPTPAALSPLALDAPSKPFASDNGVVPAPTTATKPVLATVTPVPATPVKSARDVAVSTIAVAAATPVTPAIDAPELPTIAPDDRATSLPQPLPAVDAPVAELAAPAASVPVTEAVKPAKPAAMSHPAVTSTTALPGEPTLPVAPPEPEAATPWPEKTDKSAKPKSIDRSEEAPTEPPAEVILAVAAADLAPAPIPIAPPVVAAVVQSAPEATPAPVAPSARKSNTVAASAAPGAPAPTLDGTLPPVSDQRVAPIGGGRDAPSHRPDDGAPALPAAVSADRASVTAPRDGAPAFTLPSAPAAATAAPSTSHGDAGIITARAGQIGQELGVAIARHVAGDGATGGGDTITLRLNPVDMGRIEVKLSFDDGGTLRAVVSADNPAALDMLRRDSADLGRALTDAGVRSDPQTLRFDTRAGSGQGGSQSGGSGQPWQRNPESRGDNTAAHGETAEDITAAYRPLRTRGRIDMVA